MHSTVPLLINTQYEEAACGPEPASVHQVALQPPRDRVLRLVIGQP
jgi:hypothetical protein